MFASILTFKKFVMMFLNVNIVVLLCRNYCTEKRDEKTKNSTFLFNFDQPLYGFLHFSIFNQSKSYLYWDTISHFCNIESTSTIVEGMQTDIWMDINTCINLWRWHTKGSVNNIANCWAKRPTLNMNHSS